MELRYSSQARAERIISVARVIFALFAFFSLQPFSAAELADNRLSLVAALYFLFAAVSVAMSVRGARIRGWNVATHVVDVAFFGAQLFLPEQSSLPRFVCILFPVLAACSFFSWRQALLTCVAIGGSYIASAVYALHLTSEPAALDALVIGGASFFVLTTVLLIDRSREEKLEGEIFSLSNWPLGGENTVPVRELLDRTAAVMTCPRLIMTWEEPDEPWLHIAWRFGNDFQWIRESPAKYDPLIVDQLTETSFISRAVPNTSAVLHSSPDGYREVRLEPIDIRFKRDFSIRDVLSLHLKGTTFTGRLFAIDPRGKTVDDLIFGEIVATFVASRMDHYYLLQRAQNVAVGEERMRLSRDLHDGVLQSLTGAALQLEAVRSIIVSSPEEARGRLSGIQNVLATDQRELRSFIRQLRPSTAPMESESRLTTRLATLTDRFKEQWGVKVTLETGGMMHLISQPLRHELYSIVNEAVANAAKHAGARRVDVKIDTTSEVVEINVRDDGSGFPFTGKHDLRSLNETKRGPVTLKERVGSLNGDLLIDSSPAGTQLHITIPLSWLGS